MSTSDRRAIVLPSLLPRATAPSGAPLTATEKQDQAIALAIALAGGTKPQWEALAAEPDSVRKVLDVTGFTEGLRRLSGFLAMVDGMLRPLLEPLEHEREAQAASEAAEIVIERVVAHLRLVFRPFC